MNQVWMREHNRVTDFLIKINPHWEDERLYQETRRVVIAEMQHVVYNEFLPLLLGTISLLLLNPNIVMFQTFLCRREANEIARAKSSKERLLRSLRRQRERGHSKLICLGSLPFLSQHDQSINTYTIHTS